MTFERLLIHRDVREEQMAGAVTQPLDLLEVASQLLVERKLDPVLPLPVGSYEPQDRPRQLTTRVVPVPFAFDGETVNRPDLLLLVAQLPNRRCLLARDAAFDPEKAVLGSQARIELGRVNREDLGETGGCIAQNLGLSRLGLDAT